ncbi:peptidase [Paenibacillus sp. CAA11]|uniref:DUF1796 family putative cysteine peptidase n=1 Tax=Paenibacillus sp. CAA11 TaxID=1532905 RepID=UPI000D38F966|nr:DUF1796 family putative cysteine peptidase [Paenibacillus sp. CAA11]AWB44041.1 peptidase [Paenibacillus sp. CAA11]
MKKHELEGVYDAAFSLGESCLAAAQLTRLNLRPFSGVIDWMRSRSLKDVNQLLQCRFAGFMDKSHLEYAGFIDPHHLSVRDKVYNIISVHNFPKERNTMDHLVDYDLFKQIMDRRIQRFLTVASTYRRILFVRTGGHWEDVEELQTVLSNLIVHDFSILLINHEHVDHMIEVESPLEKVYAVSLPLIENTWSGNDPYWDQLFSGISLNTQNK